ncbi:MAG TPA: glycogen/starch synthase, partial [Flavobacteriaceae bacterium]|nr:glycogen/starch synthase [Flavobacteriaceae bacterium]
MNILHISAECYPIAKVGGLADVVGALPKYQNTLGVKSEVIMPYYNTKYTQDKTVEVYFQSFLTLGENSYKYRILKFKDIDLGFNLYLVDVPELLFKDYVYSTDDTERFLAFQIAVLDWVLTRDKTPDIIHCHDHHTGLVPFLITQSFKYKSLATIPTLITIHNAQYQGWFSHRKINLLPSFDSKKIGLLDWNECINPLAAAIKCAWKVTTVSKSYMEELQKDANGLENLLKHENEKCIGILNGIDTEVWNPETDNYIIENFNINNVAKKRIENKKWLCKKYNLDIDKPLFAFIGRLVGEKGAELLPQSFEKALEKYNISVFVLGSGINEVEKNLIALKNKFKGHYNAFIGYDEKLSHIIYSGT